MASVDHDVESRTLFVRFNNGALYAYFGVSEAEYEAFVAAESKGRFFAEHIREAYDFHHVEEVTPPRD